MLRVIKVKVKSCENYLSRSRDPASREGEGKTNPWFASRLKRTRSNDFIGLICNTNYNSFI
jgi:hypothetical protein